MHFVTSLFSKQKVSFVFCSTKDLQKFKDIPGKVSVLHVTLLLENEGHNSKTIPFHVNTSQSAKS